MRCAGGYETWEKLRHQRSVRYLKRHNRTSGASPLGGEVAEPTGIVIEVSAFPFRKVRLRESPKRHCVQTSVPAQRKSDLSLNKDSIPLTENLLDPLGANLLAAQSFCGSFGCPQFIKRQANYESLKLPGFWH
jgi:hypothetical protein